MVASAEGSKGSDGLKKTISLELKKLKLKKEALEYGLERQGKLIAASSENIKWLNEQMTFYIQQIAKDKSEQTAIIRQFWKKGKDLQTTHDKELNQLLDESKKIKGEIDEAARYFRGPISKLLEEVEERSLKGFKDASEARKNHLDDASAYATELWMKAQGDEKKAAATKSPAPPVKLHQ